MLVIDGPSQSRPKSVTILIQCCVDISNGYGFRGAGVLAAVGAGTKFYKSKTVVLFLQRRITLVPKGRIRLFDSKVILYAVVFSTTGTILKGIVPPFIRIPCTAKRGGTRGPRPSKSESGAGRRHESEAAQV
tara:strand:- start:3118 stop:3513 length:396 start_codon:yes stop_codon:yes gene_type:complete